MRVTSDSWILAALVGSAVAVWLYPGLEFARWAVPVMGIATLFVLALFTIPAFFGLRSLPHTDFSERVNRLMQPTAPVFALSGLLCGIWWGIFNVQNAVDWHFPEQQWREPVEITLLIEEIVNRDPHRIRLDGRIIANPEGWPETFPYNPPRARLHWYGYTGEIPEPGETWHLTVRLRPASGLLNQAGFNYQVYLLRNNIRVTGSVTAGERIGEPYLASPRQQVFEFYQKRKDTIRFGDLMLALSIGERQWMDNERWQVLQHTGVAHLMAISGLHLTFVFGAALWLLKGLSVLGISALGLSVRGLSFLGQVSMENRASRIAKKQFNLIPVILVLALFIAFSYAALAGFAVATMRALLLISVFVIARLKAAYIPPSRVLLRAVGLVILLDPFAWLDMGFWLSAGAVFAIFLWQWRLPRIHPGARFSGVRQLWRLEVMLTLMLLPLSLLFFQGMSLIAPLTNMVVVPVFSFLVLPVCLMVVVLIFVGRGGNSEIAGQAAEWLIVANDQILNLVWQFLTWCNAFNYAWLSGYQNAVGFVLITALCLWLMPLARSSRLLTHAALCIAVSLVMVTRPVVDFAVHVLDVGQGSAIVIEQNGYALLFDAGPAYPGGFDTGAATVIPFLRFRNLKPEYMVLSHPHRDHTGGAEALRSAHAAMQVFSDQESDLECAWGQQWIWRNVRIKALAPMPGPSFGPNNDSCVLQLTYPANALPGSLEPAQSPVKVLLTGDIQQLTELRMVGRYGGGFESDLLMIPHHGSSTSSQKEFLALVQPEIAVASRGYLNQFSMPRDDVQLRYKQKGTRIYDTALHGQVSLYYQNGKFDIKTYREQRAPWWFNQQQRDAIW